MKKSLLSAMACCAFITSSVSASTPMCSEFFGEILGSVGSCSFAGSANPAGVQGATGSDGKSTYTPYGDTAYKGGIKLDGASPDKLNFSGEASLGMVFTVSNIFRIGLAGTGMLFMKDLNMPLTKGESGKKASDSNYKFTASNKWGLGGSISVGANLNSDCAADVFAGIYRMSTDITHTIPKDMATALKIAETSSTLNVKFNVARIGLGVIYKVPDTLLSIVAKIGGEFTLSKQAFKFTSSTADASKNNTFADINDCKRSGFFGQLGVRLSYKMFG